MAKHQINGTSFNVEATGNGPTIVALHGFTGSTKTWDNLVTFAKDRYTFVAIDMLGHGKSDSPSTPERYDIFNCIKDVEAILFQLQIERANWIGYSMGGRIALAIALALSEKTLSLTIESASPGLATQSERNTRITQDSELANWIVEVGLDEFVDYWENLPLFTSQKHLPDSQRKAQRKQRLTNNPVGLANSLKGIGTGIQTTVKNKLCKINFPTLLICGNLDIKFTQIAHEMHKIIPQSQVREINDAGHAPHFEKPSEFNQIVLEFLDSINGTNNQISPSTLGHFISNPRSH